MESAIDRVFHIMATAEATIADVTIRYGMPEEDANGGAIGNMGGLILNDSTVTMSRSNGDEPAKVAGASITRPTAYATLNNSMVTMNNATTGLGNGGGYFQRCQRHSHCERWPDQRERHRARGRRD